MIPLNYQPYAQPNYASPGWDVLSNVHNLTTGFDRLSPTKGWFVTLTSDAPDLIFAGQGTWQATDMINGGGGVDTIRGYIPGYGHGMAQGFQAFAPTVTSIERAELVADKDAGAIDFTHWDGLRYADVDGSLAHPSSFTEFLHIPAGTILGVNDYASGDAKFDYASAVQTADLYLTNVGKSAQVHLGVNGVTDLHLHVSGIDDIRMDSAPQKITVDGAGHLKLYADTGANSISYNHVTIDASHTTGGIEVSTSGLHADVITFGSGADTYGSHGLQNIASGTNLATG